MRTIRTLLLNNKFIENQAHWDSVVDSELFLQRLDEQGLKISSLWEPISGRLIADILWSQLCGVWRSKEEWAHRWQPAKKQNKQMHSESKSNSSAGQLFKCQDSSHVQHKIVTQFVPIAAVKTVEALTRDLKK